MKLKLFSVSVMCLSMLAAFGAYAAEQKISIVAYGVYGAAMVSQPLKSEKSSTGTISAIDPVAGPVLLRQTDRIDAAIGTRFGITIAAEGGKPLDAVPVIIRVQHPPITNPETGKSSQSSEWKMRAQVGLPRYTGWKFQNAYELAAGTWKFEVVHSSKTVAQQTFVVSAAPGSKKS